MLHEVSFPSFNGRDQVQGWIYAPAAKPAGIVQLIHGLSEHSRRYLHMIVKLLDAGYIVAADDHVGHGKTAVVSGHWGDWGDRGFHTMTEDEHSLSRLVREQYPNLPLYLIGHSMGSFIARDYMARYGGELSGAVICGTGGAYPELRENIALLQQVVESGQGEEPGLEAAKLVMGGMNARFGEGGKYGIEWICDDPYVQMDSALDPFGGYGKPTTNRAFLYLCQLMDAVTGEAWAEKVPGALPVYNIAGDQDPVGLYGVGVCQVSNWLTDTGHHVRTRLYPGYRHEILQYPDLKNEAEDGILTFLRDCSDDASSQLWRLLQH